MSCDARAASKSICSSGELALGYTPIAADYPDAFVGLLRNVLPEISYCFCFLSALFLLVVTDHCPGSGSGNSMAAADLMTDRGSGYRALGGVVLGRGVGRKRGHDEGAKCHREYEPIHITVPAVPVLKRAAVDPVARSHARSLGVKLADFFMRSHFSNRSANGQVFRSVVASR